MRKLVLALAGAVALVACDPTETHEYSCTETFGSGDGAVTGCLQLEITEVEGNVAEGQCESRDGEWEYHACASANRVPGYCDVPGASDYTLSGKSARVYFYEPATAEAAQAACESIDDATWVAP